MTQLGSHQRLVRKLQDALGDHLYVAFDDGSVAHALQSEADQDQPTISVELPIGGHRCEGLLPPVVSAFGIIWSTTLAP